MRLQELNKIRKLYFGYEEIARVFEVSRASAKVTASRYVRQGLLGVKIVFLRRTHWEYRGMLMKY